MADIIKIAEAVAKEVKGEVMFAPELDLKGLKELHIIVVPAGLKMKPITRTASEDTLKVQVGVLKKATEDDVVGLVNTVIAIGRSFLGRKIEGATCRDVEYAPLYYPEHLRERRQFTGIIELTFKVAS